jgi:carbamoylphosphate synthase large subunit
MTFTFMLTCAGDELAPEVINMLHNSERHEISVVAVDVNDGVMAKEFADNFAVVPGGDEPGYVDAVLDVVDRFKVDLVLPKSDEEALTLSRHRQRLEAQGCMLACADHTVLEVFNDKARTFEKLSSLGLRMPDWTMAHDLDELRTELAAFLKEHDDAVVKPTTMRGGRGVYTIRKDLVEAQSVAGGREIHLGIKAFENEYLKDFSNQMPAMIMERLVEPVFDLDMLAWQGKPVHIVPRRRVSSALPNEGHTFVESEVLTELGDRIIREFNLSWLYDCDVMFDQAGNPGVLEINPRPSGSMAVTIAAGVPLLDDLISLAKGEQVKAVDVPVGTIVKPYKALQVSKGTR